MHQVEDTIAAIATASEGAIRGIVRISGPRTSGCLRRCFRADSSNWMAREVPSHHGGQIELPAPLGLVPADLYWWPTERSYTRQPTAELHTIGSLPILESLLRVVCAAGARLAEPGEFTMRAFLAGRIDLTQAEAVLGVIDARDRQELNVALNQLGGGLAAPLGSLRERLLDLLAHLEAGLDFAEEDIEFISSEELLAQLGDATAAIESLHQQMDSRLDAGQEQRVVLIGSPNVGKSSLLNALAGENAAIVSDEVGTTRDFVMRRVRLGDLHVTLIDTAGVSHETSLDAVAAEAQGLTLRQQEEAHLCLFCLDATRPPTTWERDAMMRTRDVSRLLVWTKYDLAPQAVPPAEAIPTSSVTGRGLDSLREAIRQTLSNDSHQAIASTGIRCRESLRLATHSLQQAMDFVRAEQGEELVAAEVRMALDELGKVVGAVYTEDLLDRVFSRFCIGK